MTWFFVAGALRWVLHERSQRLPALRGSNQRAAAPATYFRPPGRPCRKESQTISLIPFRIPWIATAVGCQSTHARLRSPRLLQGNQPPCLRKLLEPETTAGQPAPVSTKAPGARDYCRATSPRVYKSSWNPRLLQGNRPPCLQKFLDLSTEGNRPSSLEQDSLPETAAGQPAPASTKAAQKLDHLGQPVPQQSRSPRLLK